MIHVIVKFETTDRPFCHLYILRSKRFEGLMAFLHYLQVLDLMVRMLGFSDEDKQRIGIAQQGGKGVVRGVLGLPGRLVGGILGSGSSEASSNMKSEDQACLHLFAMILFNSYCMDVSDFARVFSLVNVCFMLHEKG